MGAWARLAQAIIEANGGTVDATKLRDFETPFYDADVQEAKGFPPRADRLLACIQTNDAFVISCPEYNASMPGLLKNTIDWVSRFSPQPLQREAWADAVGIAVDGWRNRGLWALRIPFEHLGARVYPDMFSPGRTRHLTRMGASPTCSCRNDSRATSSGSWI